MTDYNLNDVIDYKITYIDNYTNEEIKDKRLPILGLKLFITFKYKNNYNHKIEEHAI